MTLSITSTKAALREQEIREDLEHSKREETDYLESVKNPSRRETPYRSLSEIRESIEVIGLKHDEAKALADAERAKLPTVKEARQLLTTVEEQEADTRAKFYAAVDTARDALAALNAATREHRETISTGIRTLTNAGIPVTGAELDGEPIDLRHGAIEHGDTRLAAINTPIEYEWAPAIQRHLNK